MDNQILSNLPVAMQAQVFSKRITQKSLTSSVWAMLSGTVKKDTGTREVPMNAVLVENTGFDKASYKVNLPWIGKVTGDYLKGAVTIEGTESGRVSKFCSAWYQREAKALPLGSDFDVDGRIEKVFYDLVSTQEEGMAAFFGEVDDYNAHRALMEGYSEALTDTAGWAKSGITDIPTVKLHPNVFVFKTSTTGAFVDWNATYATYEAAIQTAANLTTGSADAFGGLAVQRIVQLCKKYLRPITGAASQSINGAKYIALISPQQLFQLQTEDGLFFKRFDNGAVAANVNFNITGIIGVYQEVLFITDSRAPVWDTAGSAGSYIVYSKPSTDDNTALSTSEVTRAAHTGANVGTMELAFLLGAGAIVQLKTGELVIKNKAFDYNTIDGMAGVRMIGMNRMEANSTSSSVRPINESSIVFASASSSSI